MWADLNESKKNAKMTKPQERGRRKKQKIFHIFHILASTVNVRNVDNQKQDLPRFQTKTRAFFSKNGLAFCPVCPDFRHMGFGFKGV